MFPIQRVRNKALSQLSGCPTERTARQPCGASGATSEGAATRSCPPSRRRSPPTRGCAARRAWRSSTRRAASGARPARSGAGTRDGLSVADVEEKRHAADLRAKDGENARKISEALSEAYAGHAAELAAQLESTRRRSSSRSPVASVLRGEDSYKEEEEDRQRARGEGICR